MLLWFVFFILSLCTSVHNDAKIANFGPYQLNWYEYKICKGPKKTDCGKVTIENIQNMSDVIFVLDMQKDCPITKGKVVASNAEANKKKKMMNYAMDKPCQHFVFGPILKDLFNISEPNCKLSKGNYVVHLNMDDRSKTFFGKNFFYGNYSFKTIVNNNVNNFICVDCTVGVEKVNV